MKVAVIVTGMLRNFEIAMSNWQWPPGCEIDYYMVTWNKTLQSYQKYSTPISALADIDRALDILPFKEVRVINYDEVSRDKLNHYRMLYLWQQAARLADGLQGYDSFVIVRPELIMIPVGELQESDTIFLDGRENFIAQFNFDQHVHAGDQILIFSKQHIPHIEKMYVRLLNNPSNNIHAFLGETFWEMRDTFGIKFKTFPHNKWVYLISRRPGHAGPLNKFLFTIEKDFIEWYTLHQMMGEKFDNQIDLSTLYFLAQ